MDSEKYKKNETKIGKIALAIGFVGLFLAIYSKIYFEGCLADINICSEVKTSLIWSFVILDGIILFTAQAILIYLFYKRFLLEEKKHQNHFMIQMTRI